MARLMTRLSGSLGQDIADSLVAQDTETFKALMYKVVDDMAASAKRSAPKVV